MADAPAIRASNRPDLKLLNRLITAEKICIVAAVLIAAIVLSGWLVPVVGARLPLGWSLMKANTALAVLFCCTGFVLIQPTHSAHRVALGRVCAGLVLLLAGTTLFEHWSGVDFGLDTLLVADVGVKMPGRMSIQSASFFVLLALSLLMERTRSNRPGKAWNTSVLDALVMALVTFALVLIAGYLFGASNLLGQNSATRTSPQTLACLLFLATAQACRRAPHDYFSVLVGMGIGSHFARVALPLSQIVTFLFIFVGARLLAVGYLGLPNAAAITASSLAALLFILIVAFGRKINNLERELRELSHSDELTNVHNRRGLYLLGEQLLRDARRGSLPLTVLFFDADGLKRVNDTLGHEVGSQLLLDIASLLRTSFRSNDVVGRLGGDEFAVIAHGSKDELSFALRRLEKATAAKNEASNKLYQISFSTGLATIETKSNESFAELVDRADAAMYQNKQQKRAARDIEDSGQQTTLPA